MFTFTRIRFELTIFRWPQGDLERLHLMRMAIYSVQQLEITNIDSIPKWELFLMKP